MTDTGQLRIFSSNGALVSSLPAGTYSGAAPLSDGSIAYLKSTYSPVVHAVAWVDASGAAVGSPTPVTTTTQLTMLNATPDGGFTTYKGAATRPDNILAQHWSKTVAAYTPANSLSGEAGVAASFATRPGVAPVDLSPPPPPAPSPPPVLHGDPSTGPRDINFTQSGCNASVCSDEFRASVAAVNAARAAERAGKGQMDDQMNAAAVLALAELAGRSGVISPDGALGTATLMREDDSLRQLVIGYGNFATMSPQARLEVFERWKNIYTNAQASGQPNTTITVADVANNIVTEDEQLAFMNGIASFQLDFQQ